MNSWSDAIEMIKGFADLRDDWDGQGAAAPSTRAINRAFDARDMCSRLSLPVPSSVIVAPSGDIVFSWQQVGAYVELTIGDAGHYEWFFKPPECVPDDSPEPARTDEEIAAEYDRMGEHARAAAAKECERIQACFDEAARRAVGRFVKYGEFEVPDDPRKTDNQKPVTSDNPVALVVVVFGFVGILSALAFGFIWVATKLGAN